MKFLLLLILLFSTSSFAQDVTFKEIKRKPKPQFYSLGDTSIIYPIVVTRNLAVNKLINDKISYEILGSDEGKVNIKNDLDNLMNGGLVNLSYEITFKKKGILSLKIYAEVGGASLYSWDTYFNFDLKTGKSLHIEDLVYQQRLDSFKKMVFGDKILFIKKYKEDEITKLTKKEIKSTIYEWAINLVDSNCYVLHIDNFSLSNHALEIIDPCEFPRIIKYNEPAYELKYSYKQLQLFLKPGFQSVFGVNRYSSKERVRSMKN